MKTKLVSAKLDRVASQLLVIFALDAAEKKQAAKPAIKLLTGKQRRGQGDGERSEQRRICCRELRDGPAARPCRLQGGANPAGGPGQAHHRGSPQGGGRSGPLRQAAQAARTFARRSRRGSIPQPPRGRWSKALISATSIPIPIVRIARTRASSNSPSLPAAGQRRLPSRPACVKA